MQNATNTKQVKLRNEKTQTTLYSSQPSTPRIPLMPAHLPSRVRFSPLQPMYLRDLVIKDTNRNTEKVPTLRNVMFELTLACNLNCIQCYCNAGTPRPCELETQEITKFIDYIAETSTDSITFTGGEPLLHKDFLSIAGYTSDHGLSVSIFTNGELLNKHVLKNLSQINVQSIQISLDGSRARTHDFIRRKKGLFNKTLSAVKESKQKGFRVIILMRGNNIVESVCQFPEGTYR